MDSLRCPVCRVQFRSRVTLGRHGADDSCWPTSEDDEKRPAPAMQSASHAASSSAAHPVAAQGAAASTGLQGGVASPEARDGRRQAADGTGDDPPRRTYLLKINASPTTGSCSASPTSSSLRRIASRAHRSSTTACRPRQPTRLAPRRSSCPSSCVPLVVCAPRRSTPPPPLALARRQLQENVELRLRCAEAFDEAVLGTLFTLAHVRCTSHILRLTSCIVHGTWHM